MKPIIPDEELVRAYLSGDARAMEVLYERYCDKVYRLALLKTGNRSDAEDVTSSVFLKLCRSLDTFRGESKFSTYIYTIASNAATDLLRRRKPAVSIDQSLGLGDGDSVPREMADLSPGPEDIACEEDFARHVLSMVHTLPEVHRSVIELRFIMDRSYQEIAEELGIELGTVKSRLNRAISALKRVCLQGEVTANAVR